MTRTDRSLDLLIMLLTGEPVDLTELPNRWGVCERTIRRCLGDVRDALSEYHIDPPEARTDERGRRFLRLPQRQLRVIRLEEFEVVALHIALSTMAAFENEFLLRSLDNLRQRLVQATIPRDSDLAAVVGQDWQKQKFLPLTFLPPHYRPREGGDGRETVFDDIVTALHDHQLLRMTYLSSSGRRSTLDVQPLTLVFYKGSFYLAARPLKGSRPGREHRVYALNRIANLEKLPDEFAYPPDWDPRQVFNEYTGMMPGKRQRVAVEFASNLASHLHSRRWPPGTTIRERDTGVRLETELVVNDEWMRWLIGFGPQARVIRPVTLRRSIQEQLRAALARYEPDGS